jgi:hypothetical protein
VGPGRRLFSFAVIADTHVNQEEGKASSDFAVNRLSNARNRYVMHALNRARPAFVLHLGDIVHPTPGHPGYGQAARAFTELAQSLECPLHLTPGNHDVGDKPGDWLPVPSINEGYLALYRQHFGANYHSFDAHGCHFVVIDAQLLNSGLADEARQRAWLERDLADHSGRRIFLCTHYPPFVFDPAEDSHYDNIDEPGRAWLLELLVRHRVEALFAGHVHNFWFHSLRGTAFYLLPSTAFVRLDYSEMYRVEPGAEQGRNDAAKLGFLIVDVHETGHVAHPVRTHGACLEAHAAAPREETLPPVHPRTLARSPLGVDLRHAWAEITDVAPSGALDEFTRKTVRNDYPLMALWEMGVRRLRVPMADLRDARTRERMRVLRACGHEFTVHSHGVPQGLAALLGEHADLVSSWEVIAPLAGIESLAGQVASLRRGKPFAVRFSKLRRPEDPVHHGQKARHVIEHGFDVSEGALIEGLFGRERAFREAFDGVAYRVPRDRPAWRDLVEISRSGERTGSRDDAMVRLAGDNPARMHGDEIEAANRVAATLFAAHFTPAVGVFLDTFADVDRGYFPRAGLVDRRYNPRMAGRVVRNLNSALDRELPGGAVLQSDTCEGGETLAASAAGRRWTLMLPAGKVRLESSRGNRWIDLSTGVVNQGPVSCATPALILPAEGSECGSGSSAMGDRT